MWCVVLLAFLAGEAGRDLPLRIETVAGTAQPGYAGDGGPARRAQLNQPFHMAFDTAGKLIIADALNHCIRRLDLRTGIITTVAGNGTKGYSGDAGPALRATLNEPYAVAVSDRGDLYIVDRLNAAIRKMDGHTGQFTTLAGTGHSG